jgi:hypothetical protein
MLYGYSFKDVASDTGGLRYGFLPSVNPGRIERFVMRHLAFDFAQGTGLFTQLQACPKKW